MGLASSQARMLLLTARKSDLEYRAQMISQRKINLAMQTEQLATQYSKSMSNRVLNFVYHTDANTNEELTAKLSYSQLMAENGTANYLVQNAEGKYIFPGRTEEEKTEYKQIIAKRLAMEEGRDVSKFSNEQLLALANTVYADKIKQVDAVANPDFFQSALRNGSIFLKRGESTEFETTKTVKDADGKEQSVPVKITVTDFSLVSWSSLDSIRDVAKTEDDSAAQAEYESKSLLLSNQDKMLDLELNQIQTQHKAIETEYDQVKKVIEKNIDVSYKIFA